MGPQNPDSRIPDIRITQAVGAPKEEDDDDFNDLAKFGGWPVSQRINSIQLVEIFATDTSIDGIRITYVLEDSKKKPVSHGKISGKPYKIPLNNEMILVGVFGGREADGHISSIGFVRLDMSPSAATPAEIFGPFGSSSPPSRSFGTYGHIIAFIGADNNETGIRSLGFVKTDKLGTVLL